MHKLLTILNVAKLCFKYWYISLTNQMTIFQLFLGALRNAVFFPCTYEISSQLLWCENMCYNVHNTCYLTLQLRWVQIFISWTIILHLAPTVIWRKCMHVQAPNREISTSEAGGANDMFFTVIYAGAFH